MCYVISKKWNKKKGLAFLIIRKHVFGMKGEKSHGTVSLMVMVSLHPEKVRGAIMQDTHKASDKKSPETKYGNGERRAVFRTVQPAY